MMNITVKHTNRERGAIAADVLVLSIGVFALITLLSTDTFQYLVDNSFIEREQSYTNTLAPVTQIMSTNLDTGMRVLNSGALADAQRRLRESLVGNGITAATSTTEGHCFPAYSARAINSDCDPSGGYAVSNIAYDDAFTSPCAGLNHDPAQCYTEVQQLAEAKEQCEIIAFCGTTLGANPVYFAFEAGHGGQDSTTCFTC